MSLLSNRQYLVLADHVVVLDVSLERLLQGGALAQQTLDQSTLGGLQVTVISLFVSL